MNLQKFVDNSEEQKSVTQFCRFSVEIYRKSADCNFFADFLQKISSWVWESTVCVQILANTGFSSGEGGLF